MDSLPDSLSPGSASSPDSIPVAARHGWGYINKRGDAYLRTLLIHGARAVLRVADNRKHPQTLWAVQVRERRGNNIAAVALVAKIARPIWAMLSKGTEYRAASI